MATLTEVAQALDVSSRWVSQLIAEGILPNAPKGQHDIVACATAFRRHGREKYIERSHNPVRERAEVVARLRRNGNHDDADYCEAQGKQ